MNPEYKQRRDEVQQKRIFGIDLRHRSERINIKPNDWKRLLSVSLKRVYDAYNDKAPKTMLRMDTLLKELEPK